MIRLDYALAMDAGSGSGLTDSQLDAEAAAFERGCRRVLAEAEAGRLGFWGLPQDVAMAREITEFSEGLSGIDDVLVIGIGGSSLGGRAVTDAIGGPPALRRGRRVHFVDNCDPWTLAGLLEALEPASTLAIGISKSGGTVETAAQILIVREWLRNAGVALESNLVFVTDPESGSLRELADAEKLRTFAIPSSVGGRFSVLTPVGLLPAALCGVDVGAMLSGAAKMAERCAKPKLSENPAGLLAAIHVLHDRLHGRNLHVLMPYADGLRSFAAWFVQLWAESLGKRVDRQGRMVESGPTPIPSVGATDQHAQVQLFMEGPRDKLITFVAVADRGRELTIPTEQGAYEYLGGHGLAELLDYERRATALALAKDGRPSLEITLPALDAESLGGLFFLFEAATAFAGELYGIDAFDQPGVELGKRLAYGLLGRKGHEDAGEEVRALETAKPSRYRV